SAEIPGRETAAREIESGLGDCLSDKPIARGSLSSSEPNPFVGGYAQQPPQCADQLVLKT
ncbi:MAG TPA: hypothetical protein VIP11_18225, partial [Gemmatimonadaceae bacterium]